MKKKIPKLYTSALKLLAPGFKVRPFVVKGNPSGFKVRPSGFKVIPNGLTFFPSRFKVSASGLKVIHSDCAMLNRKLVYVKS